MHKTDLLEIISKGENSGVEFKRDAVRPADLAKEICAFLNFNGGIILIGIDDSGEIKGTKRENLEEWIISMCRDKIKPEVIPYYEGFDLEGRHIAVLTFSPGLYVHHMWHNNHRYYYIRVGFTSREASPEELQRLFQQRGQIRFDLKPVPGSSFHELDFLRIKNYFQDIRRQDTPTDDDIDAWKRLLVNTEIMVIDQDRSFPSVGGLLLFGKNPEKFLPQSGISAIAYKGLEKDYNTTERGIIRGAVVARFNQNGEIIDTGVIERAIEYVRRNTHSESYLVDGRRIDKPLVPENLIHN